MLYYDLFLYSEIGQPGVPVEITRPSDYGRLIGLLRHPEVGGSNPPLAIFILSKIVHYNMKPLFICN